MLHVSACNTVDNQLLRYFYTIFKIYLGIKQKKIWSSKFKDKLIEILIHSHFGEYFSNRFSHIRWRRTDSDAQLS